MCFADLLAGSELDAPLCQEIDEPLGRKQCAGETEYGPHRPLLYMLIRAELERGETPLALPGYWESGVKELDRSLYETIVR